MPKSITHDIVVSVDVSYQKSEKNEQNIINGFAYRITIVNSSDYTVQLISRHWFIKDILNGSYEVKGEGVIGQQPIIEPGASFTYVSGVSTNSCMGIMHGYYTMERIIDGVLFDIKVPAFKLVPSFLLN
jgi:ApaG protein